MRLDGKNPNQKVKSHETLWTFARPKIEYIAAQVNDVGMRTNDSFVFGCCVQTMESYFCYSMEKCLHYSANNTKLDSSEIFPPHTQQQPQQKQHQKKYQKKKKNEVWSNTSIYSSLLFIFRFFHFVVLKFWWTHISKTIAFSRLSSVYCSSIHFDWLLCCPHRLNHNPNNQKVHETHKKAQNNIKLERKSYRFKKEEKKQPNHHTASVYRHENENASVFKRKRAENHSQKNEYK